MLRVKCFRKGKVRNLIDEKEKLLIKKAMSNDLAAFETLIKNYEKLIFNYAYKFMGNVEDAKDISQDVIVKIYKNIQSCKDDKNFKKWVYTITGNTCIDELRKRKNKNTLSIDMDIETEEGTLQIEAESKELSPEQAFFKKESLKNIGKAFQALSPEHKEIIMLRDIEGYSYEEISEMKNITTGTVKSRISRGRNKLKEIILKMMEQNKI